MSKRTERMSRSAVERINRKDTVIRQNNVELEELRNQYENLDICEEDKQAAHGPVFYCPYRVCCRFIRGRAEPVFARGNTIFTCRPKRHQKRGPRDKYRPGFFQLRGENGSPLLLQG